MALHTQKSAKRFVPNAKIVFGGIHVSSVPEIVIANDFIDYVVIAKGNRFPGNY